MFGRLDFAISNEYDAAKCADIQDRRWQPGLFHWLVHGYSLEVRMKKLLIWFVWIWSGLVILLNLAGIAGFWIAATSFNEFWADISSTYSPFNIWTHGLNLALLLPAFGAWRWAARIGKQRRVAENVLAGPT